jgi:four helix bundle protein
MRWLTPNHPSFSAVACRSLPAASSVPANLAEGHGRTGRVRSNYWRIAYASAKEVDSHLRLLLHAGAINQTQAVDAFETFDAVRAMTWRLLNPKT